MNRLKLVNKKLLHYEVRVLFDGDTYRIQDIGISGYGSSCVRPNPFQSIQSALDYIAELKADYKINDY